MFIVSKLVALPRKIQLILGGALIAVAIVATAAALAFGGSGPSRAACKSAMEAQFNSALGGSTTQQSEPAACNGLSGKVLTQIAAEVLNGK